MKIIWTDESKSDLSSIESSHFSQHETSNYKKRLVREIVNKINLVGKSVPSRDQGWEGTYKVLVHNYKVYYSYSHDGEICYIETVKHVKRS